MIYDDTIILEKLTNLGEYIELFQQEGKWQVSYRFRKLRFVVSGRTIEEAVCNAEEDKIKRQQEYESRGGTRTPICRRCNGNGKIVADEEIRSVLTINKFDVHNQYYISYEQIVGRLAHDVASNLHLIDCPECLGYGNTDLSQQEMIRSFKYYEPIVMDLKPITITLTKP